MRSCDSCVINEAQRIPDIGVVLKLIIDNIPHVKVIATGSSSLDLANRTAEPLTRLLRALAYKIGSQVSYTELGQICGLDNKTVEKYITILEQTFVIFRLSSYSRN